MNVNWCKWIFSRILPLNLHQGTSSNERLNKWMNEWIDWENREVFCKGQRVKRKRTCVWELERLRVCVCERSFTWLTNSLTWKYRVDFCTTVLTFLAKCGLLGSASHLSLFRSTRSLDIIVVVVTVVVHIMVAVVVDIDNCYFYC